MGTTTTTFTLTVTAQSSSLLAALSQQMVSEFGASPGWSNELSTPQYLGESVANRPGDATTINETIGFDGSGAMPAASGGRTTWSAWNEAGSTSLLAGAGGPNKSHWDGSNWWHVCGPTGSAPYAQTVVRYDPTRDEFRHWQGSAVNSTDGIFHPLGHPHSFGASCIDASRGRIYRGLQGVSPWVPTWTTGAYQLGRFDTATRTTTTVGAEYQGSGGFPVLEFAPEVGAEGSVIVFRRNDAWNCQIFAYDVAENSWDFTTWGLKITPARPTVAYTPGYIYCTGESPGSGLKRFHRLNLSTKQFELRADTPVEMNSNGNWPDNPSGQTLFAVLNNKIYAFNSGPSNASDGAIYVYDIATNVWSGPVDTLPVRLSGWATTAAEKQSYTVTAAPEHNLVLFACQKTAFTDVALAWKPPG